MAARLDDAAAEAAEDALLRGVRAAFGAPPPLAAVLTARGEEADEEVRGIVDTPRAPRCALTAAHAKRFVFFVMQPC
jgi:hypothetical protein